MPFKVRAATVQQKRAAKRKLTRIFNRVLIVTCDLTLAMVCSSRVLNGDRKPAYEDRAGQVKVTNQGRMTCASVALPWPHAALPSARCKYSSKYAKYDGCVLGDQEACHYEDRAAEVKAFNQENVWRKRGISMATCRFVMTVGAKPATVHVYHGMAFAQTCKVFLGGQRRVCS